MQWCSEHGQEGGSEDRVGHGILISSVPAASCQLAQEEDALPVEWKGEQRDAAEVGLAIKQESEV